MDIKEENMNQDFLIAEEYFEKADYDNALKYYIKIGNEEGYTAESLYKLGIIYSLKGFFNEAENCYLKAISKDAENIDYNYALAYLYFMNGKLSLSERTVDYILSLNVSYLPANALKLLLVLNSNDIVLANSIVNKISQIEENDDFMYYSLSSYYSKLNRWEKAIYYINKAIEIKSDSCEYKSELAKCYYELKQLDKAKEICRNIIELNDKYIYAYILISKILFAQKEDKKAFEYLEMALKLDINSYEAHILKGDIFLSKEDYALAINSYKIALAMMPTNEELYSKIGSCYFKQEDYENAYTFYKEAADINVICTEYRYYMAKTSEKLGKIEDAISSYSVLKRLEPNNIAYIEEYANFLCSIDKKASAVSLMKSASKNAISKEQKFILKEILEKIKKY